MTEEARKAIASSLGNPERDFIKEPLDQREIEAVIRTYSKEVERKDLDPALREIYVQCIEILKKHVIYH